MKGRRQYKYQFLILQLILYISFLYLDITGGSILLSNYIKFTVVALCFLYVLLIKANGETEKTLLFLRLALFFTLVSDMLILLLDCYFYGVLTFIIAQQLHGIRISLLGKRFNHIKNLIKRLLYQLSVSLAVCLLLWKLNVSLNALLAASIFYFSCILSNTIRSLHLAANVRERRIKYFAAGLVLFLLCDINVGLFNMSDFLPVGPVYGKIYLISSVLMWTFYAPSQVLIALSGDKCRNKI
ncbi:MAG TPA: lysoplasmalogenase family protein [Mobilitalea sp.]|nr:lysoplasmalogenase family protein [Mobilitalea sp.]